VLFLAYTGVRWGELAALRVGRIDFLRRRALIAESVTVVRAAHVWGTRKGNERREVPIPRFLVDELSAHVHGMGPQDLVFAGVRGGGALRSQVFRRACFDEAACAPTAATGHWCSWAAGWVRDGTKRSVFECAT
jgi:integrase